MARNRIIYQSEAVFVGPTGSGSLSQIQRVQSVNHTATISRTDVNQLGKLAAQDRVILTPPTVSLTFEALLVNAINANRLGFVTDGSVSCIANILSGVTDVHNFYIALAPEGSDMVGGTGAGCFGFGNGFISNANYKGAVGGFPTESYTVDALNYRIYEISSGAVPTVNPTTGLPVTTSGMNFQIPVAVTGTATSKSALQPGDITVTLSDTFGFVTSNLHIQNFDMTVPLAREDVSQLGTKFAFAKFITFPVSVTASFDCVAGEIQAGAISDRLCSDAPINLTVTLKEPDCSGNGAVALQLQMKQAKLDSTNYTSNIGANATCTFNYSAQIGAAADTTAGLFMSGISA